MKSNSLYEFISGSIDRGDFKYYLILTHSFDDRVLNATHLIKIIQYGGKMEFDVDFEISSGSPIWIESKEIKPSRSTIKNIFEFTSREWRQK